MQSELQGLLECVLEWYESKRARSGRINTNVMTVGLVLTEKAKQSYPLRTEDWRAASQIRGISGATVTRILASHGETRSFTSEGGRTSRGSVRLAEELIEVLDRGIDLDDYLAMTDEGRIGLWESVQRWFVERVKHDYFDKKRLSVAFDLGASVEHLISTILETAGERGGTVAGAVAQHLVGAQLQLNFPSTTVGRDRYTVADQQTQRPGDFSVNDAAFHVTTRPSDQLMTVRCQLNLQDGFRPFVLVPARSVSAAEQLANNANLGHRISIVPIESFIAISVGVAASYGERSARNHIRILLETYNERVSDSETDPSLLMEIPANL